MNVFELILKSTIVLLSALAVAAVLARRPAALRHFVYTAAFTALLVLPFASAVAPAWRVSVAAAPAAASIIRVTSAAASVPVPVRPLPWLLLAWTAGCLAVAVRFAAGTIRISRIVQRGSAASVVHGVRVVESPEAAVPMTWGIRKPVVILPVDAAHWPSARLQSAILHERAHIQRRDLLAQTIAQAACCFYWFHPLAWTVLRQLRKERELAADDAVLRQGVEPHDYAGHLMETARSLAPWLDAPAMADISGLESRIASLLDRARNRRPLTRRAIAAVIALAAIPLTPIATMTAYAQGAGSVAGIVLDPSGAVVPQCTVKLLTADGVAVDTVIGDLAGAFKFAQVPAGVYTLEVLMSGFKRLRMAVRVAAGAESLSDARLALGEINEAVTVVGNRNTPAPPQPTRTPQRIAVGGNLQAARLIAQPRPVYSDELKQLGIEGVVQVRAMITREGTVLNPFVINNVDKRLADAAIDAITQWRYSPTLLNGTPVEVLTTIEVAFQLAK